jgi:hypothetical protein
MTVAAIGVLELFRNRSGRHGFAHSAKRPSIVHIVYETALAFVSTDIAHEVAGHAVGLLMA